MVFTFEDLRKEISHYLDNAEIACVEKSYKLAEKAHREQKRQSGEPYITHPVAAAITLAKLRMDYQTLMATLLHDVLEDTPVEKSVLIDQFGIEVANLVDGVSKLTQINFESREEAQAENFRKMILAMVGDIRVILVKLADRLHNMQTLEYVGPLKRRRKALETLEIYAPIANRLGMHSLRLELEDLGFAAYYPTRYKVLKAAVAKARGNRKEIMKSIQAAMKEALNKHPILSYSVQGRKKHLYSIYKKMVKKHLAFNEITDVYGFRIVTDTVDNCYRILGVVHGLYKPLPEKFKDYIAISKANGYQALHTTLFGPFGVPIEVQIRTVNMDNIAEHGIAAHWLYKSGENINTAQIRAQQWMKNLLEMQQSTGNSLEFIENVKIDLFPDEVYVFTPKGIILELPAGATPVDFAYMIHSDIGNTCVAAKIDRRPVPLSTILSNGQTIEIVTSSQARPNFAWLNFVVTGKARSNIRHFLKTQQKTESLFLGKKLLNSVLASARISWQALPSDITQSLLDYYQVNNSEELYIAISIGDILPLNVFRKLTELVKQHESIDTLITGNSVSPIFISGIEGNAVNFAVCCHPIPGDSIIGIIQSPHGLTVHCEDCSFIRKSHFDAEKYFSLQWDPEIKDQFPIVLEIEAINQRGLLARLSTIITSCAADINNIHLKEIDSGKYCHVNMTISVSDRVHLARVIRKLRHLFLVSHITRKKIS